MKPFEMATSVHAGAVGGEVVGGRPIDVEPPVVVSPDSGGKLFSDTPIKPKPPKEPKPVASSGSPRPAWFGPVALLLVGLVGGGLYLGGAFSGSSNPDQPAAVRPDSSPTASVATPTPESFELAQNLFNGTGGESPDKPRAVSMLKDLALGGSLESQKRLGEIFSEGEFGDVDFAEAFKWLLMAAEQGDAEAQMAVGASYSTGHRGVKRDLAEAVQWLKKSASQDFGPSQMALGVHYYRGLGVEQDLDEARDLFRRAESSGVPGAAGLLAELESSAIPGSAMEIQATSAKTQATQPTQTTTQDQWKVIAPSDARASFKMPSKPRYFQQVVTPVKGQPSIKVHLQLSTANDGKISYVFAYNDLNALPTAAKAKDQILEASVRGSITKLSGELAKKVDKIKYKTNPGREFVFRCVQGEKQFVAISRIFLVGRRLYQTTFVSLESEFNELLAAKFLNSFRLLKPPN